MKRGDVIIVRQPGTPANKARPCVVIQHGGTLEADLSKVTVCGLTSRVEGSRTMRPLVQPSPANGLRQVSAVEIDWIYTHPATMIAGAIGQLDGHVLAAVDDALRDWLDL